MSRLAIPPPLPLTREIYRACFFDRSVQAGQTGRYVTSGGRGEGVYLYDRKLYPASPQLYMMMHTPKVSALLWQRVLLSNRQQRNTALSNYLFAVSGWSRDLFELSGYAKGEVVSFTPGEYDIVCQPEGMRQPVSIFNHPQGRAFYWQHIQEYPANVLADQAVIFQYQEMARAHHNYLASQLQKNKQQLMFNGWLYQSDLYQPTAAYRLQDVVKHSRWLQVPEQYPVPLFPEYKPELLSNKPELLLVPSVSADRIMDTPGTASGIKPNVLNNRGPAFARCFHHFPQPDLPPAVSRVDKEDTGIDEAAPGVIKRRYENPHQPSGKSTVRQVLLNPGQQMTTLTEGISCLEGCFLAGDPKRKPDSRERLDRLFNDGQLLFANTPYSIDRQSTLRFITLFRNAVEKEIKKAGEQETEKQRRKKAERLQALDEIKDYVATLSDHKQIELKLAVQLCGRVRERAQVHQLSQRYCGGFAILQSLWGSKPLRAVRIVLSLAKRGKARVKSAQGGSNQLTVPKDCSLGRLVKYSEALADILPLCTLYNCTHYKTATVKDDAANAVKLGLAPMLYRKNVLGTIRDLFSKKQNKLFIDAFCKASKHKIPVRGGIGPRFLDYLNKKINTRKRLRKPNFFLRVFGRVADRWTGKGKGHAVIFEDFQDHGDNVEFKVYTWGRSQRLTMNKALFLGLIDKRRFLITDITPMDSSNYPKRLGRFIDVHYLMSHKKL